MTSIKKTALPALCALAVLGAVSNANAGSIVTDGGFTNGLTGWTVIDPLNIPGVNITPGIGVTVVPIGNDVLSTPYGDHVPASPGGGTNAAYFVDDNAVESISQLIQLAPHTEYTLSYSLLSTTSGAGNINPFRLTDVVTNLVLTTKDSTQSAQLDPGVWTTASETFTTGAALFPGDDYYLLSFDFTSGPTPAKDLLLTDVAIPEPTSLALLGLGMIGTGAITRRRRQSTPTIC